MSSPSFTSLLLSLPAPATPVPFSATSPRSPASENKASGLYSNHRDPVISFTTSSTVLSTASSAFSDGSIDSSTPFSLSITTNSSLPNPVKSRKLRAHNSWLAAEPEATPSSTSSLEDIFALCSVEDRATNDQETQPFILTGVKPTFALLDHQVMAVNWMKDQEANIQQGGILADDMGLGKTVQMLAVALSSKAESVSSSVGENGIKATLIICPVGLMSQWEQEIKKMSQTPVNVINHHGPSCNSGRSIFEDADFVITSYGTLMSDYKAYTKNASSGNALFSVKWFRTILDEAHEIKNHRTIAARACFDIESQFRWCLTGTPIQNKLADVFSLIKFLRATSHTEWEAFKKDVLGQGMEHLQSILKGLMLRRTKALLVDGTPILQLPPIISHKVICEFSPKEACFYRALQNRLASVLDSFVEREQTYTDYQCVLSLLVRLRQACCHPSLTGSNDEDEDADATKGDKAANCAICFANPEPGSFILKYCPDCEALVQQHRIMQQGFKSAKILKLLELLQEIADRSGGMDKTIIFSEFTEFLSIVASFLHRKNISFAEYNGGMTKAKRDAGLQAIAAERTCILISTKAGGAGLNLTMCNNVILMDIPWNPAIEDQACGHAHRIGQTKPVNIYKLTVLGTIEDRILRLQEKKRSLIGKALSNEKSEVSRLGLRDIIPLFE